MKRLTSIRITFVMAVVLLMLPQAALAADAAGTSEAPGASDGLQAGTVNTMMDKWSGGSFKQSGYDTLTATVKWTTPDIGDRGWLKEYTLEWGRAGSYDHKTTDIPLDSTSYTIKDGLYYDGKYNVRLTFKYYNYKTGTYLTFLYGETTVRTLPANVVGGEGAWTTAWHDGFLYAKLPNLTTNLYYEVRVRSGLTTYLPDGNGGPAYTGYLWDKIQNTHQEPSGIIWISESMPTSYGVANINVRPLRYVRDDPNAQGDYLAGAWTTMTLVPDPTFTVKKVNSKKKPKLKVKIKPVPGAYKYDIYVGVNTGKKQKDSVRNGYKYPKIKSLKKVASVGVSGKTVTKTITKYKKKKLNFKKNRYIVKVVTHSAYGVSSGHRYREVH